MYPFGSPVYLGDSRIPRVVLGAPPMRFGGVAPLVGGGLVAFPGAAPPVVVLGGGASAGAGDYSCGGRCYGCCGKSYCMASHGLSCCDSCRPMNHTDFGCGGRAPRHCTGCCAKAAVLGTYACARTAHTRSHCSKCAPAPVVYAPAPAYAPMPAAYVPAPAHVPRMVGGMVVHSSSCIGCCARNGHIGLSVCAESVHTMEACPKCRRR